MTANATRSAPMENKAAFVHALLPLACVFGVTVAMPNAKTERRGRPTTLESPHRLARPRPLQ